MVDTNTTNEQNSFDLKITTSWLNDSALLTIKSNESVGIRAGCDICCVIDISGSMSSEVNIQSGDKIERSGLSQLDIAKHALKTIINSLTENDRLSVVSFDNRAKIVFELKPMDDQGRQFATQKVEGLRTAGSTNLWDGLKTGLDVLSSQQRTNNSNAALFLLTDGDPTEIPTGGHLVALEEYKKQKNFTCSVNTFGFGYTLDSQLLDDLARIGNSGSYAFIPDGTFVGTVFVNAISNLLTTVATNIKLTIEDPQANIDQSSIYLANYSKEDNQNKVSKSAKRFKLLKSCFFPITKENQSETPKTLRLNLGSLIFGQTKNVVVPMSFEQFENLNVTLDYQSAFGQKTKQTKLINKIEANEKVFNQQKHRLELVHFIRQKREYALQSGNALQSNDPNIFNDLQILQQNIENHATDDEYLADLLKDLTGQVQEALCKLEWFHKWGRHYLPSLANAHLYELCNNFKDPGVQHYGKGELFDKIRDEMDSIFCGLPAPVQSIAHSYDSPSTPISMSAFNNSNGVCFHGSCTVKLLDGSIKFVRDIQRGDQLYPHGGQVRYVVQTMYQQPRSPMVLVRILSFLFLRSKQRNRFLV